MRALPFLVVSLIACGRSTPPAAEAPAPAPTGEPSPGAWTEPAPEPAPAPAAAPSPPPPPPPPPAKAGAKLDAIAQGFLDAHNRVRGAHCAPPLAWSSELAAAAQKWANHLRAAGCAFEHSNTRYGENLAAGTAGAMSPEATVDMWYREIAGYNFKRGTFSMQTGHFTQVVWVGSARLGCGVATCRGMEIHVCNYDPPGNVHGHYPQNVKPKGCK